MLKKKDSSKKAKLEDEPTHSDSSESIKLNKKNSSELAEVVDGDDESSSIEPSIEEDST